MSKTLIPVAAVYGFGEAALAAASPAIAQAAADAVAQATAIAAAQAQTAIANAVKSPVNMFSTLNMASLGVQVFPDAKPGDRVYVATGEDGVPETRVIHELTNGLVTSSYLDEQARVEQRMTSGDIVVGPNGEVIFAGLEGGINGIVGRQVVFSSVLPDGSVVENVARVTGTPGAYSVGADFAGQTGFAQWTHSVVVGGPTAPASSGGSAVSGGGTFAA